MQFCSAYVVATLFCIFVNMQVIISAVSPTFRTCRPEELAACAEPLQNSNFISSLSNKEDIDKHCRDWQKSVSCIHAYTRLCMNLTARKRFQKLFHGTQLIIQDLCTNETYQNEYLLHAPCMATVAAKVDVCSNISSEAARQVTTKDQVKRLCCAFIEYVNCSTQSVRARCGDDAADFSEKLLDKMISALLTMHCTDVNVDDCKQNRSSKETILNGNSSAVMKILNGLLLILVPLLLNS